MKAYFIGTEHEILCESMDTDFFQVGAFIPFIEANYYSHPIIGFNNDPIAGKKFSRLTADQYLDWIKSGLREGSIKMDNDFPFDPEQLRVIEAEMK